MIKKFTAPKALMALFATLLLGISPAFASEADLVVPSIREANPFYFNLLLIGIAVSVVGLIFGFIEFMRVKKLEVHTAMADVGNTIFETCKTYLVQQGKFLFCLEVLIGLCIAFYFGYLQHMPLKDVAIILVCNRYFRLLRRCLVWYQNEHSCKRKNCIRIIERQPA